MTQDLIDPADIGDLQDTGPIDYFVVELPNEGMRGEAFGLLVDLVDRGLIRVLDLVAVRRELDGSVSAIELTELPDGFTELTVFDGARSGLLGQDDLDEALQAVEPGSTAAVLVIENVWAAPFATALRRSGAQLVASGRIPVQAILAALEAAEADAG